MTEEHEYFTGKGTYNRNEVCIGTHDGKIYVNIDDEYIIDLPNDEVDRMIAYLQKLRGKQ